MQRHEYTKRLKSWFHTYVTQWYLIQMAQNLQWAKNPFSHYWDIDQALFSIFLLHYMNLIKNPLTCNAHIDIIWMKFGRGISWGSETTLMNISRVDNFTCSTKIDFCHTYRINNLEQQAEIRFWRFVYIVGVPLGCLSLSQQRYGTKPKKLLIA